MCGSGFSPHTSSCLTIICVSLSITRTLNLSPQSWVMPLRRTLPFGFDKSQGRGVVSPCKLSDQSQRDLLQPVLTNKVPIQDLNRETARGVSTCAMCWLGTQDPGAGFVSWCHRVSHVLRQVPRPLSCRFFRGRVRASGLMRGFYSHARWDHLETYENQSTRCPGTWKA